MSRITELARPFCYGYVDQRGRETFEFDAHGLEAFAAALQVEARAEQPVGSDIDAELLQFKRDSLRRKLAATSPKAQAFFWNIWAHAPCKATTVDELPVTSLMDSLRLCDRTILAQQPKEGKEMCGDCPRLDTRPTRPAAPSARVEGRPTAKPGRYSGLRSIKAR